MQKDSPKNKETLVKEMFKSGAHFGYTRTRRHPSVNQYIYGYKNKTAVIDLDKATDSLAVAQEFIKKLAAEGKQILFVGNKNEAKAVVKKYASVVEMPYVVERWIGGTFTNFKQIHSRILKLQDYRAKEKAGELSVYTKKERSMMAIEFAKMEKYFTGIENMEKLPAAMLVIDSREEKIAVAEAKRMNIPVISLSGSDCDIRGIDYPIIVNDASRASIEFFLAQVVEAYREGKVSAQTILKEKAAETKAEAK